MFYIAVLSPTVPAKADVWPLVGQNPELAEKVSGHMTDPDLFKINVDVRSSVAFEHLKLRPYMYAVKLMRGTEELEYEHLTIVVLHNLTKEQHNEEHTKQRLKFQQPDIEAALLAMLDDVEYSELEQHITSTGNGMLIMRDVPPGELRNCFALGNRANFKVIEGTKP